MQVVIEDSSMKNLEASLTWKSSILLRARWSSVLATTVSDSAISSLWGNGGVTSVFFFSKIGKHPGLRSKQPDNSPPIWEGETHFEKKYECTKISRGEVFKGQWGQWGGQWASWASGASEEGSRPAVSPWMLWQIANCVRSLLSSLHPNSQHSPADVYV